MQFIYYSKYWQTKGVPSLHFCSSPITIFSKIHVISIKKEKVLGIQYGFEYISFNVLQWSTWRAFEVNISRRFQVTKINNIAQKYMSTSVDISILRTDYSYDMIKHEDSIWWLPFSNWDVQQETWFDLISFVSGDLITFEKKSM